MFRITATAVLSIAALAATTTFAEDNAPVRLVGTCAIAGNTLDLSGLDQQLIPSSTELASESTKFTNNLFGGISAITWSGEENTYWMLPDRGPLDGAVDWTCRVQKVRIVCNTTDNSVETKLLETVILHNENSKPYTGSASAFTANAERGHRFDPEGICVGKNGNLFVSDEYGPHLVEFTPQGKFVQEFKVPSRFLIENPDVSKPTENPKNLTGRATNRGMEGLTISLKGHHLFGLMQSSLLQDADREQVTDKPKGMHCRLPHFDVASGTCSGEFVYRLDDQSYKLNEILACNEHCFVVIERDGEAGNDSAFKKLMLVCTDGSSDVSSISKLPAFDLPSSIQAVKKNELIDLLDPRWGLAGEQFPEKVEGLAFGPDVDEQHRLLLVASDNDFSPEHPTMIYAFVVKKSLLCQSFVQ